MRALVDEYIAVKHFPEAIRVLDASRTAMGNDPDLLYWISSQYVSVDQPQTSEDILAKVIALDPRHAAANNDLGYSWADQGKNLDRAESIIRLAVEEEPDNESFLDSLGWVLYKRTKFGEARLVREGDRAGDVSRSGRARSSGRHALSAQRNQACQAALG